MIIIMKMGAGEEQIREVLGQIEELGFQAHLSRGEERTIIGVIGDERPVRPHVFELMQGVERTVPILQPFKLASRDFKPEDTVIPINGMRIGSREVVVMAGPCAVETRKKIILHINDNKGIADTRMPCGTYNMIHVFLSRFTGPPGHHHRVHHPRRHARALHWERWYRKGAALPHLFFRL